MNVMTFSVIFTYLLVSISYTDIDFCPFFTLYNGRHVESFLSKLIYLLKIKNFVWNRLMQQQTFIHLPNMLIMNLFIQIVTNNFVYFPKITFIILRTIRF